MNTEMSFPTVIFQEITARNDLGYLKIKSIIGYLNWIFRVFNVIIKSQKDNKRIGGH